MSPPSAEDQRQRRNSMAINIKWKSGLDEAIRQAKAENKPILLDFFNPQ
jgi:hypothetical protein